MNFTFIMGTAGSGKSALALALSSRIASSDVSTAIVNLDPGVRWLPYSPDVDIRDYVNYDKLVDQYNLGPNGALVACVDAAVTHVASMRAELEKLSPDYVIVDTPGQMELFAYRDAGTLIASSISEGQFSTIFLADSIFLNRASDFVSLLLLAYSVQSRFMAPQINCVSKVDLLPRSVYEKGILWTTEPEALLDEFVSEKPTLRSEISARTLESLIDLGALGEFIFTSSNTGEGLDDLYAQIQRVHQAGEDR
ncbi:MAG: ATP/GTP-binding protein [Candidatus Methanomethylicia archaeon]|nr:ATP/GTP-binding protein [Candidatus Methanomethylicia archaeon]